MTLISECKATLTFSKRKVTLTFSECKVALTSSEFQLYQSPCDQYLGQQLKAGPILNIRCSQADSVDFISPQHV